MRTSSAFAASVGSFASLRGRDRVLEQALGVGEVADLEQRLAQLGKEREPPGSSGSSSEVARSSRFAAAAMSPRSNARRPVGGELGRGPLADRARVVVDRTELEQVPVGLLEVVAEDLLVLGLALPVAVDLLGPVANRSCRLARVRLSTRLYAASRIRMCSKRRSRPPRSAGRGG